ncbi:MAG TPA: amino acid adenylation domain-containing protein, partial [Thermoanaerobaculia bacterium]|nr:amino acid adenylation domain-containing protein [Thermoanaerobaculia bacterium]
MNAWELLSHLRQREIQLWIEGDRLRLRAARGELSDDLRSRISEHKAELLSLLREAHPAGTALPPLEPVPRAGPLPLSFSQERLWVINRIEPGQPIYNSPAVLRLAGPLRIPVLGAALGEIVRRHEVLRTTFPESGGEPVQRVSPAMPMDLPFIDLAGLPLSIREQVQGDIAAEEIRRPFALERGPLLRIRLIRLAPELHVLLFTLHHIVFDGWSTGVIVREVAALYEALARGWPSPLPELAIQYGDFAAWQRRCLRGEALEHELSYWRERLAGAAPVLAFATDHPRPAIQSFRGASLTQTVPAELAAALEGLSLSDRTTLFMTLLAAFQILLYRHTGQDDLNIGTPVAGRSRTELEGLIGLFVNTLVLRADLAGDPNFRGLLAKVREDTLEAFAHQDLPLEKLVAELLSDRNLGHNPLFQVMLALQNAPRPPLALSGLEIEAVEIDTGVVRFDLALSLTRAQSGLSAVLRYASDLFDRATAERMLAHFRTLLEGIAADPERRISELPLLSPSERHQALVEGQGARTAELGQSLAHEGFEEQARRRPQGVAVVFEGESLTYGELNRRANRLAWRLRRLGVGPESRVGICLERSLEMMVALLAVLKAGGSYVPLDPTHPSERLSWLWEDCGAVVLLARPGVVEFGVPPMRVVDPAAEGLLEEPAENPAPSAERDHLVYVLYTSGTTGRPKGVMVPHRGVVNHLRWRQAEYGLGESDCLVHKAPLGFDASVWELLWPLSVGARLIVARPGGHQDVSYLVDLIRRERVTFLHAVPSLLRVLLKEPGLRECTSLRWVTTGGEPLPQEVRERFFTVSAAELLHGYGPTEASIGVTYAPCERRSGRPTTLGRPIANAEIYLTDRELSPVPLGAAGELCIGGVCLARGYLGRPELTAERFIPHPWSGEPGARLYRSGDLVRRRADGGLEFLGRIDHQVKVRGIRIEPAEIESVLSTHPGVREAVVLAREGQDGDKRLVAYVVDGEGVETEALRSYLSGKLPPHMVPSGFVVLDSLPLMANGKVDRLALTRLEP